MCKGNLLNILNQKASAGWTGADFLGKKSIMLKKYHETKR